MPSNTNEVNASPAFRNSLDFCEAILAKNNSFRALGALLSSARLADFDPGSYTSSHRDEAENRQSGIGQLFDLIISDQERAVELFMQEHLDSDEHLLKTASGLLESTKGGAFIGDRIPESIFKQTMEGLHMVIARDSGLRPVAEAMVEAIGQYAPLSIRKVAKGGA